MPDYLHGPMGPIRSKLRESAPAAKPRLPKRAKTAGAEPPDPRHALRAAKRKLPFRGGARY